jgi:hypothetical protein
MYIDIIPNRGSRPTILLREAWRDGKKVRKRTIANLTGWPDDKISALKLILKGEPLIHPSEAFVIEQSLSCGHVHAMLKLIENIRFKEILGHGSLLQKNIVITMVVHTLFLQQAPHLADCLWRGTTILDDLGLRNITIEDVTGTLDWLTERREHIEGQGERIFSTVATVAYDRGMSNTARALLQLLAEHVNMNLHRALSPLLSQNAIHEDACARHVQSECPLSLYTNENLHEPGMQKEKLPVLSLFDIVDHLSAQCHIRLRITSIPGGLTVNLRTSESPLHKHVFELIEAYKGKGPVIETASWRYPHPEGNNCAQAGWMHTPDLQDLPLIKDMDRSLLKTET